MNIYEGHPKVVQDQGYTVCQCRHATAVSKMSVVRQRNPTGEDGSFLADNITETQS